MDNDKKEKTEDEKSSNNLGNQKEIRNEESKDYDLLGNEKLNNSTIRESKDNNIDKNKNSDKKGDIELANNRRIANIEEIPDYYKIIEEIVLKNVWKYIDLFYRYNLFRIIKIDDHYVFDEDIGDNLIKFLAREITNVLVILIQNIDINQDNLLKRINIIKNIIDSYFVNQKNQDQDLDNFHLPGGDKAYLAPECYINKIENIEDACKRDFFSFGAFLFLLKFGIPLLYRKVENNKINVDHIIDLLTKNISFIKSQTFIDEDFISFIVGLISYKPKERFNFQQIYRNRWLNKNIDELEKIIMCFENDGEKLIMELQKKDFIMKKEDLKKKENKKTPVISKTNKYRFKKKQK